MATVGDINLLQTKTSLPPELGILAERLKTASFVLISIVLAAGVFIGGSFLFLSNERQALAATKQQLLAAIVRDARKEGLFIFLKERIPIVEKALNSERQWDQIMQTVSSIALPPKLLSISADDHGVIQLNLKADSIEEVMAWTGTVIDLISQKSIRSAQLVSLQLTRDGSVLVSLSFIPN